MAVKIRLKYVELTTSAITSFELLSQFLHTKDVNLLLHRAVK